MSKYDSLRKTERDNKVRAYAKRHPNLSHQEIANHFVTSRPTISRILSKGICKICNSETVMFKGKGLDSQYKICPDFEQAGHKSKEEITAIIQRTQRVIKPSGRFA